MKPNAVVTYEYATLVTIYRPRHALRFRQMETRNQANKPEWVFDDRS